MTSSKGFVVYATILLFIYVSNGNGIHNEADDLDRMAEFADVRIRMSWLFDSIDDVITAQATRMSDGRNDVDEDFNVKVVELIEDGEDLGDRISDVIKGSKGTYEDARHDSNDDGMSGEKETLDKLQVSTAFIIKRASSLLDTLNGNASEEEAALQEGLETLTEKARDVLWALKSVDTKRRVKAWRRKTRGKTRRNEDSSIRANLESRKKDERKRHVEQDEIDTDDYDSDVQQDDYSQYISKNIVSGQSGHGRDLSHDSTLPQNNTFSRNLSSEFDDTWESSRIEGYQDLSNIYGYKQTWSRRDRWGTPHRPSTTQGSTHYFDLGSLQNYLTSCSDCAALTQTRQCPLTNEINNLQMWSTKLQQLLSYGCFKPRNCRASGTCCVKGKPQFSQTVTKMADLMRVVRDLMDKECREECTKASCRREPQWSGWSVWTPCDVTCGQGSKLRRRQCSGSTPNGRSCRGNAVEYQPCQKPSCCNDLIVGHWLEWTSWSRCVCATGRRTRERKCTVPPSCRRYCKGPVRERRPCSRSGPNCDPCISGNWSAWAKWSSCSVACGRGTRQRGRRCDNPPSNECGVPCPGGSVERGWCNGVLC